MIKSKISAAIAAACLISSVSLTNAAPLNNNSILYMDAGADPQPTGCTVGTCFGMEVQPMFWIWTLVEPGVDGGIVVGKDQVSGGQELASSPTNTTPADMTAAWFFFGNYGTFYANHTLNSFSDTSNDGTSSMADFNVAWNASGIPMGNGTVNDYQITLDGAGGGSYSMDYTAVVPAGHPSGFGGVNFRLLSRGGVMEDPGDVNSAPTAGDVSLTVDSGVTGSWPPAADDVDIATGDSISCAITTNATQGTADIATDCSNGTYTSGAGYDGPDSFQYTVTDSFGATATGTVNVTVNPIVIPPDCEEMYPVAMVTTIGGGQSSSVNATVTTTFTGHIVTESGLTSGGKNAVKICPGSTVSFETTSTIGTANCTINSAATASTGTLAVGDKLICTNKPDGSDTDRFSIKNGL